MSMAASDRDGRQPGNSKREGAPGKAGRDDRSERLAEALRANLRRRKEQTRERRGGRGRESDTEGGG